MQTLRVDRSPEGIVTVALHRPEKKNAIDATMWDELLAVFREVAESASDRVGVSVLGAPTGWLILLSAVVPGVFAGAWALARGIDGHTSTSQRWLGWAACLGISVALLSLLALVLLRVPRG